MLFRSEIEAKNAFIRYLNHEKREILAEEIKRNFLTEKSKTMRYLIEALESFNPSLLTINTGHKKQFYRDLKNFLNRDIGTHNSIFQCNFDSDNPHNTPDKDAVEKCTNRIQSILYLI